MLRNVEPSENQIVIYSLSLSSYVDVGSSPDENRFELDKKSTWVFSY
jgi:hypothetical protein